MDGTHSRGVRLFLVSDVWGGDHFNPNLHLSAMEREAALKYFLGLTSTASLSGAHAVFDTVVDPHVATPTLLPDF